MKNYLPIGSVVLLNEGNKKLMIYGRRQLDSSRKLFDYIACLYPEGNISDDFYFFFNNEDIAKVVYRGFEDNEERDFVNRLNENIL